MIFRGLVVWMLLLRQLVAFSSKHSSSLRMSSSATNALINCPTIPLRDSNSRHPAIGFGTYKVGFIPASASSAASGPAPTTVERTAEECVSDALSVGYRFLECAEFYGNESEVGKAISKSGIDRKDLYLCSKVWTTTIEKGEAAIRSQVEKTLTDLQTDYIDLYLVHWPVPNHHVNAYKTLMQLKSEGKIKGIGVSNYAVSMIIISSFVQESWTVTRGALFAILSTVSLTLYGLINPV
jgi:aryl-alcohol dehydrogenase-like predicted oxidoreductase